MGAADRNRRGCISRTSASVKARRVAAIVWLPSRFARERSSGSVPNRYCAAIGSGTEATDAAQTEESGDDQDRRERHEPAGEQAVAARAGPAQDPLRQLV